MKPRPKHSWEYERTRLCRTCGEHKPFAIFHACLTNREGFAVTYHVDCQPCRSERERGRIHNSKGDWRVTGRWLPIQPLRDWLVEKTRSYTMTELENMCGVSERVIYRQLHETKYRVSLDVADRILTNAGVALWELYPDD